VAIAEPRHDADAFIIRESVPTAAAAEVNLIAGTADYKAWKALRSTRSLKVTVGGTTQTVAFDFSAVTSMTDVATVLQVKLAATFADAGITVTWVAKDQKFTVKSTAAPAKDILIADPDAALSLIGNVIVLTRVRLPRRPEQPTT